MVGKCLTFALFGDLGRFPITPPRNLLPGRPGRIGNADIHAEVASGRSEAVEMRAWWSTQPCSSHHPRSVFSAAWGLSSEHPEEQWQAPVQPGAGRFGDGEVLIGHCLASLNGKEKPGGGSLTTSTSEDGRRKVVGRKGRPERAAARGAETQSCCEARHPASPSSVAVSCEARRRCCFAGEHHLAARALTCMSWSVKSRPSPGNMLGMQKGSRELGAGVLLAS